MSFEVFLANLPVDLTEEQLRELCAPFGEVVKVDFTAEAWVLALTRVALVELNLTPEYRPGKVLKALNKLETAPDWPIIASPATLLGFRYTSQEVVSQIAQTLGETDKPALKQIGDIVAMCGPEFASHLLEKTLKVEASGGLLTLDGTRRRTPGGTFLYLVRVHLSPQMRAEVFPTYRDRRLKARQRSAHVKVTNVKHEVTAAVAEPPLIAQPSRSEDDLAARSKLAELRQTLEEARRVVEDMKMGKSNAPGGFFTAAKRVVDLQKQVDALLQEYPQLQMEE